MEYNKTKNVLDKIAGAFVIVMAVIYLILSFYLIIEGYKMMQGYSGYVYWGIECLFAAFLLLTVNIVIIVFSVKLFQSPYLPNGKLRKKKAARILVLVLSILTFNLVVIGLMIAALCVKDFKDSNQMNNLMPNNGYYQQKPMNNNIGFNNGNQNDYIQFLNKIQELKNLKSLGIIDDVALKKAVSKIVIDLIKDN